jgi:predicted transporter
MNTISLKQGILLFGLVFIAPAIVAQPFRAEIMDVVPLAEPTLWQSANLFIGSILVAALAIYAWNKRKQVQELEREVERQKHTVVDD